MTIDHRVDDRRLSLGLDLIGDDEAALARLQQRQRILVNRLRIHEPPGELGKLEELGRSAKQFLIHVACLGLVYFDRRIGEEASPPRELSGRVRVKALVEREGFRHARACPGRIAFDPWQLLVLAESAQLGFQSLLRDRSARRLEDARLVVQDEGTELKLSAESTLEENPCGA